ncbi:MAG TPA: CPBP family glutamic-type intramembrane protease [Terracidiphilus sp.]|nr:CPBP family glutamic-type intramembrane protease [Terracidiphilus sp.]
MTSARPGGGRMRSYLEFVVAVFYFFLARSVAHRVSIAIVSDAWMPLLEQAMLMALLILGYACFGIVFDHQKHPIGQQGLPQRKGWFEEASLGLAIGWGTAVIAGLILMVAGGIAIVWQPASWRWLTIDALYFAVAAMAEEVAFRGYGFQRFVHSVGPVGATLGFAIFYAVVAELTPGANRVSFAVSIMLSLVLSLAYLRTRALWVSWGLNFGWKASRALIFGLTIAGVSSHSSVVEGIPMGSFWFTGGGYGLDGSWMAFLLWLVAWPVVYRATRELDFRYNVPVFEPGGVPVDLDAAARAQHEAAMGQTEPAAPALVQILPASASEQAASNAESREDRPADPQQRPA